VPSFHYCVCKPILLYERPTAVLHRWQDDLLAPFPFSVYAILKRSHGSKMRMTERILKIQLGQRNYVSEASFRCVTDNELTPVTKGN